MQPNATALQRKTHGTGAKPRTMVAHRKRRHAPLAGLPSPAHAEGLALRTAQRLCADSARMNCEDAFRRGTGSNAHILLEEVSEAIEAAHDPAHLRAELVQVAAVAMKWIEQIDRRGNGSVAEVANG